MTRRAFYDSLADGFKLGLIGGGADSAIGLTHLLALR
jgi:hypothetical protein